MDFFISEPKTPDAKVTLEAHEFDFRYLFCYQFTNSLHVDTILPRKKRAEAW